jgi:tRNA(fMet)-specific endonuclease VapC
MRYMLDTNVCIAIMKRTPPKIRTRLEGLPLGQVGVSSIVIAELWYGIDQSQRPEDNEEALRDFMHYVTVKDWPASAAPEYGRIRTYLRKKGTPIGAMDLLIASHALSVEAVLVTNNVREFKRVPKLKVENWISS